jgi:hypothetical protein
VLRVILWVVSGGVMLIEVTCEGPGAVRELMGAGRVGT